MSIRFIKDWRPPEAWPTLRVVDAHTEGEPLRVVLDGLPPLPGNTILERRAYMKQHLDHFRRALMWEPRGHADMYGVVVTPPVSPEADFGVIFLHNEGYSTMCGHGIIGISKVVLELGMMPMQEPETALAIDTPAGLVRATAQVSGGKVRRVAFRNVPSFVLYQDRTVEVPGVGPLAVDVAFGGAFYAFVDARTLGLELKPAQVRRCIELGTAIKQAVMAQLPIPHPFEADLSFLYGTIFVGPAQEPAHHSRHVCIFAEGEVDRSPTGTGVSARLALLHRKGHLPPGQSVVIESIIGSTFGGRIVETTRFGPHPAVIPEVEGTAYITGVSTFCLDPDDPLKYGFFLR